MNNRLFTGEELQSSIRDAAKHFAALDFSEFKDADPASVKKMKFISNFENGLLMKKILPINAQGQIVEELFIDCVNCRTTVSTLEQTVANHIDLGYGHHFSMITQCNHCCHYNQDNFILKMNGGELMIDRHAKYPLN